MQGAAEGGHTMQATPNGVVEAERHSKFPRELKMLRSLWTSALPRIDEQFSAIEDFGKRANSKRVSEFEKSRARGN